jgi:fibronectin-binding autotransporter adhesin
MWGPKGPAGTLLLNNANAIPGGIGATGGTSALTFNSSGTAGLNRSGAGTLYLSNAANTYTGATTLDTDSTVCVSKLADGGADSSIGKSTNAAANLSLNSRSTLRYLGSGDSTNRSFTISGAAADDYATLDASGAGAVSFTNTASPAYGTNNQTRTLILTGANTGTNTLAANIANNGTGAVSVTKSGPGKWVLSGSNTYTGNTTVSDGTLDLGDNASLKFVIGATAGTNNEIDINGTGSVSLAGDFLFDLTAVPTSIALDSAWTIVDMETLATAIFGGTFSVTSTLGAFTGRVHAGRRRRQVDEAYLLDFERLRVHRIHGHPEGGYRHSPRRHQRRRCG